MMKAKLSLINAINDFDGYSEEAFVVLRDILCDISERRIYETDPNIAQLLYVAARKMRAFGYNKMSGLDELNIDNDLMLSINEIIDEYYTSSSGYQLDYEQKKVIDKYESSARQRLFLSAPTAFGKTFILKEIILRHDYNTILLIFPTVSLLNENTNSLKEFIKQNNLNYEIVNTTRGLADDLSRKILILTPERVLKLFTDHGRIPVDFFFMDEVYKVDNFFDNPDEEAEEDDRDKVFRIVLYNLSKQVQHFYLAGPYINTSNMGLGFSRYLEKNEVSVHEVSREMISKKFIPAWRGRLIVNDTVFSLPSAKLEKLNSILEIIHSNELGGTLVYMASKSQIDAASRNILQSARATDKSNIVDRDMRVFLSHLKRRYGFKDAGREATDYWSLPSMLATGYGTHHGSLPKYIQEEILGLFNTGSLHTIISTTSITEGVNTAAKNVIFYGSTKGGKELKVFDVKNINGRAGRYYHNFIGRIFFMEKSVKDILENRQDESLDFATYSDKSLDGVDLDNADSEDLTERNSRLKNERDREIVNSDIPDSVFKKNRLVDNLKQVALIKALQAKDREFFLQKSNSYSNVYNFLRSSELKNILDFFHGAGVLEEHETMRLYAISSTYSQYGFAGLLSYEIKKIKEKENLQVLPLERYDACYRQAFAKIRNIVEFRIPKLLSIYSHMFAYVSTSKGVDFNHSVFESIVAFYELGVHTDVGIFLAEKGFPVASIRILEQQKKDMMSDLVLFKRIALGDTAVSIFPELDEYEVNLLRRYLD